VTGEAGVVRSAAHRHPDLGGHKHLVPAALQDLAQDLLGQAAGVDVGRVDEVDPASRHMSTWRLASATSVDPTLANGPRPPKVIVPMVSTDTRKPDLPSARYSIRCR